MDSTHALIKTELERALKILVDGIAQGRSGKESVDAVIQICAELRGASNSDLVDLATRIKVLEEGMQLLKNREAMEKLAKATK